MTMIEWNMRRDYVLRGFYDLDDPPMRWEKKPPRPPNPDRWSRVTKRTRALLAKVWRLYLGLEPSP